MATTIFLGAFVASLIYYRILFFLAPKVFDAPLIRRTIKKQWHHLHTGLVFMLAGTIVLLLRGETPVVFVLLGLGLGLTTDLFISSLLLETNRKEELVIYKNSLWPSMGLGAGIAASIIILQILF